MKSRELRQKFHQMQSTIPIDSQPKTLYISKVRLNSYFRNDLLLEILSRKLEKAVVECTPRGGSEVNVIFADNTSRVVKLANENQPKDKVCFSQFSAMSEFSHWFQFQPRFDSTLDFTRKHKPLLRTVSERTHSDRLDHNRFLSSSDSLVSSAEVALLWSDVAFNPSL